MANNQHTPSVIAAKKILIGQKYFYTQEKEDDSFAAKVYTRSTNTRLGDHWDLYKQQPNGQLHCITIFKNSDARFIIAEFKTHESNYQKPSQVTSAISTMPLEEFLKIPAHTPAEKFIQDYAESPPREEISPIYRKFIAAQQHPRGVS